MSEDELHILKKQVQEIYDALLGGFESQGLVSRLRKLEDRSATINKILIVLGTGVVGLILNIIRDILK